MSASAQEEQKGNKIQKLEALVVVGTDESYQQARQLIKSMAHQEKAEAGVLLGRMLVEDMPVELGHRRRDVLRSRRFGDDLLVGSVVGQHKQSHSRDSSMTAGHRVQATNRVR